MSRRRTDGAHNRYDGPQVDGDRCCPGCGRPVPRRSSRRGQPRSVCGPDCSEVASLLRRLDTLLCDFDATPERAASIRSQLWGAANRLNRPGGIRWRPLPADE